MVRVAVSGLNAVDTPAPGIPVIRCLKEEAGFSGRMIGLAYDALDPGVLDRDLIDAAYLLPYPKSGKDVLLERLSYIHQRDPIDLIIPNLDAEILNFIQIKEALSRMGIRLLLPSADRFMRRAKINLPKLADDIGIRTPRTRLVTDLRQIEAQPPAEFPLMVKGVFYEAYTAHSTPELTFYAQKIVSRWGYPLLIQSYIEGEEFNAVAVGDGSGNTVGCVCMKKLTLTDKGKGWACITIKNEPLMTLTEQIVSALGWTGALEVEAIYSKTEDCFYLIEINPRFPAWVYLACAAGDNLPYLCLQLAMGGKVKKARDYKTGVVFSNYTTNLIADLDKIQTLFTTGEIRYEKTI